jgi:hypothetical protein
VRFTQPQLVDLDADGVADVLAAQGINSPFAGRVVRVLRNADGTLRTTAEEIPSLGCEAVGGIVAGEFSGDGRVDVAVSSLFCGGVEWMAQTAAGAFVRRGLFTSDQTTGMASLRLVGSTRSAIAATTSSVLKLWRPAVSGEGFAAPEILTTGTNQLWGVSIVDFNGDGRLDIAAKGLIPLNPGFIIALQRADGGFDTRTEQVPTMGGDHVFADMNGDGRPDLVFADRWPSALISVRYQASDGSLGDPESVVMRLRPSSIKAVDFNGDGRMDLVVSHRENGVTQFSVVLQTAAGTLGAPFNPFEFGDPSLIPDAAEFVVADFTGDGRLDFLVGNLLVRQKADAVFPSMQTSRQRPRLRQDVQRAVEGALKR